jgi:hypothetical protein
MREEHSDSFTEPQFRVLAQRNCHPKSPILESCPRCSARDTSESLQDHIAAHMKPLALRSLPLLDVDDDESAQGANSTSVNAKAASRSTIKEDP